MNTKRTGMNGAKLLASPRRSSNAIRELKRSPGRTPSLTATDGVAQAMIVSPVVTPASLPPPRQAIKRRRSPISSAVAKPAAVSTSSPNKATRTVAPPTPSTSPGQPMEAGQCASAESVASFPSSYGTSPDPAALTSPGGPLFTLSRAGLTSPIGDDQLLNEQRRQLAFMCYLNYCRTLGTNGTALEASLTGASVPVVLPRGGKESSASALPSSLLLPGVTTCPESLVGNSSLPPRSASASLTVDSPIEGLIRQDSSVSSSDEQNECDAPCKQRGRRNYKNMTRERRIEANARERTRVHTIGAAFETLRQTVPAYSNNQKLSKLAILRIACSYILSLSRLADLDYSEDQSQPDFSQCMNQLTQTIQTEGKMRRS